MPFPDLPPERIPGSPEHLNDHQLIDQALDYIQQAGYRDDPDFPPLPDVPVLGQSGHVTAHDRILAVLEYVKQHPMTGGWGSFSNTPTGTYKGDDGHNYKYVKFTTSGTLTVTTQGWLDVLVVGGSGGGTNSGSGATSGGGGGVRYGGFIVPAGSHAVTVGKGGAAGGDAGADGTGSALEGVLSVGGGQGGKNNNYASAQRSGLSGGGSPGGFAANGHSVYGGSANVTLNYTGSSVTYGAAGGLRASGKPGVVVVRTRTN